MVMKMSKKSSRGRDNHVCLVCHLTFKGTSTCPICRRPMLGLSHKMRVPARRDGKGYLSLIHI